MKFTGDEIRKAMLLYAITDRTWLRETESLAEVCSHVLDNGATFLQIREKDLKEDDFEREAAELKTLCEKYRVPFVVNDNVQIALDIDADGVHVGQSDIRGRDIRSIIGPDGLASFAPDCSIIGTGSQGRFLGQALKKMPET